jgi:hypothetical protein
MSGLSRTLGFATLGAAVALVFACSSEEGTAAPDVTDASGDVASERAPEPEPELEDEDVIPCGPRRVLQTVCQSCHTRPPRNGAPFPLVTRSNIVRRGVGGREVRELMIEEVEARRMPLAPVTIDDASRATLLEWLKAGSPAVVAQQCTDAGSGDAAADADAAAGD